MSKSKKEKTAQQVAGIQSRFQCPYCGSELEVVDSSSMVCKKNHTFDFAKQGYINLLTGPVVSHYDTDLFTARQKVIMESKLFGPLYDELLKWIDNESGIMLDVGCGEGSHLHKLIQKKREWTGIGLDISKEGIQKAAKSYEGPLWLVGDLAKSPFSQKSIDVILNVLSPSNYKEFKRILAPGGTVIKVVPNAHYLKELRAFFFTEEKKQSYSNEQTVTLFKTQFAQVETVPLRFTKTLSREELPALAKMTPLGWSSNKDRMQSFLEQEQIDVTIDLELLIARV